MMIRKNILALLLALSMVGLTSPAFSQNLKIALVVKNLGNGFFEASNRGAQEAATEIGGMEVIYTGPTTPTAEGAR